MSLVMLTNFTQTNGYVPTAALTTIKKDDDKVNITASTEDVDETITRVRQLVALRNRVVSEGMSRASAKEFVELAPEAIPLGFGLEMFTELPTRVNMSYGTESIIGTAIDQLGKLIKFLIEKIKKASEWLVDAYQTLTGVKPTAYRMAQRSQYVAEMEKQIEKALGTTVNDEIKKELAEGMFNAPKATAVIEGAFIDSTRICDSLMKFTRPIEEVQRLVEDTAIETAYNINQVGAATQNANLNSDQIKSIIVKALANDKAYVKLQGALRNIAKMLLASNIYKSPGKDKSAIVDDLSSPEMKKLLDGLSALVNKVESYVPTPEDIVAQNQVSDQDVRDIVKQLGQMDPSNLKDMRKLKEAVATIKYTSSNDLDFATVGEHSLKFYDKQADINTAIDVSRGLTADFSSTVLKFSAVRDNIKNTAIVNLVQAS